jgi:hypothetical protein
MRVRQKNLVFSSLNQKCFLIYSDKEFYFLPSLDDLLPGSKTCSSRPEQGWKLEVNIWQIKEIGNKFGKSFLGIVSWNKTKVRFQNATCASLSCNVNFRNHY